MLAEAIGSHRSQSIGGAPHETATRTGASEANAESLDTEAQPPQEHRLANIEGRLDRVTEQLSELCLRTREVEHSHWSLAVAKLMDLHNWIGQAFATPALNRGYGRIMRQALQTRIEEDLAAFRVYPLGVRQNDAFDPNAMRAKSTIMVGEDQRDRHRTVGRVYRDGWIHRSVSGEGTLLRPAQVSLICASDGGNQ